MGTEFDIHHTRRKPSQHHMYVYRFDNELLDTGESSDGNRDGPDRPQPSFSLRGKTTYPITAEANVTNSHQ